MTLFNEFIVHIPLGNCPLASEEPETNLHRPGDQGK